VQEGGECPAHRLTAAQRRHGLQGGVAPEVEGGQRLASLRGVGAGDTGQEVVEQRARGERPVGALGEHRDAMARRREPQPPVARRQFAGQEAQERRLATAVRPNDRQPGRSHHGEVERVDDGRDARSPGEGHAPCVDEPPRRMQAAGGKVKGEVGTLVHALAGLTQAGAMFVQQALTVGRQPSRRCLARLAPQVEQQLRLVGVLARPLPPGIASCLALAGQLHLAPGAGERRACPRHLALGRRLLVVALPQVVRVRAAVARRATRGELDDAVHAFQQVSVVAGDDHAAWPRRDQPVQVPPGVGVQMVGGLVEQQQVGSAQEESRQGHARPLATADGA